MFSEPAAPQLSVQQDVQLIVSGNFSPDALGPDTYRAILERLAATPREHLEAFRTFVRERRDAGRLSTLHLPHFLTLLARTEPDAAREAAPELLAAYESAARDVGAPELPAEARADRSRTMRPPPETEHDKQVDRLRSRIAELQRLINP